MIRSQKVNMVQDMEFEFKNRACGGKTAAPKSSRCLKDFFSQKWNTASKRCFKLQSRTPPK